MNLLRKHQLSMKLSRTPELSMKLSRKPELSIKLSRKPIHVRGVFDKFEDNIDNILMPKRKVWSTLSLETLTYFVRIVYKSL